MHLEVEGGNIRLIQFSINHRAVGLQSGGVNPFDVLNKPKTPEIGVRSIDIRLPSRIISSINSLSPLG